MTWPGLAWPGMAWHGMAWPGMAYPYHCHCHGHGDTAASANGKPQLKHLVPCDSTTDLSKKIEGHSAQMLTDVSKILGLKATNARSPRPVRSMLWLSTSSAQVVRSA